MAFIKIGSDGNDLTFEIPTDGTTNWGQSLRTLFFNKLNTHNHTGGGNGAQIGTGSLADNSISTIKIQNDAVNTAKILNDAVTTAKILDANITAAKLAANSVATVNVIDDAIDDTKIRLRNNQFLTARNLADDADVDIVKVNASNVIEFAGSVTATPAVDSVGTAEIQDDAVTTAKIADNQITNAKMADNSVNTAEIVNSSVTQAKLANSNVLSNVSNFGTASTTMQYAGTSYTITIQNSNRPLLFQFVPVDGTAANANYSLVSTGTGTALGGEIVISSSVNPASTVAYLAIFPLTFTIPSTASARGITIPISACNTILTSGLSTGAATFYVHCRCTTSNTSLDFNSTLKVIEL